MGRYRLEAVGENAKELKFLDGGPDLMLWQDKPIFLGRGVRDGEGYKYPNSWNALSSRHCTLKYHGPEVRLGPAMLLNSFQAHHHQPVPLRIIMMSTLQRCARACSLSQHM
jgi:hypothetical protein